MKKLRYFILKSWVNFILFGILIQVPVVIFLSFTSFSLKGAYIPQLIATIIFMGILYYQLVTKGKKPKDRIN